MDSDGEPGEVPRHCCCSDAAECEGNSDGSLLAQRQHYVSYDALILAADEPVMLVEHEAIYSLASAGG